ncbi:MAG TPA: tagaturonate reductase [Flavisolibacter sp.]|jgi:tagaturonate reductase|nr:tagaturonate reductase [Flavisolibacter sp.]
MILSRYTIRNITNNDIAIPDAALFSLPEKVLQFGTGVLLRGLPDYFIDKANRQGIFNGRIVVVKSTAQGDITAFHKQDCLYTLCVRGLQDGELVEENSINASISRVLSAATEWQQVLECAHNPEMKIILSNTTEVGIRLENDDIRLHPPKSFPGKLLSFLYERFKAFGGSKQSGMVIVPTEMIPGNGKKLEAIVFELAHLNGLDDAFIEWLEGCNTFCNSLVDRIVPGKPDAAMQQELENNFGYADPLLIMAEAHRLWAIEGDASVREVLSFVQADSGVFVEPDIEIYRELKLRLLNGVHTFTCGLAYLAGCETVRQSMDDAALSGYMAELMLEEISPSIPYPVDLQKAHEYTRTVLARFQNPFLQHQWLSISLNYSAKMQTRCVPVLLRHYAQFGTVPELMALGFAAYLCFTRPVVRRENQFYGERNGETYLLQDAESPVYYRRWNGLTTVTLVQEVLRDKSFWGSDLSELPGFGEAVLEKLSLLLEGDVKAALRSLVRA